MSASPGYFYEPKEPLSYHNPLTSTTGHYFINSTLADPTILREVLSLETEPQLRPASIIGYRCKLWGRHPALLDAPGSFSMGLSTTSRQKIKETYLPTAKRTGIRLARATSPLPMEALLGSLKKIAEDSSDVDVDVA
ncbi:unnamed protein product [Penicillium pancosmium]